MMTQTADLTIYTSASLKDGRCGFGYLAVRQSFIHLGSGSVEGAVANSFQAEVQAAEAAMADALKRTGEDVATLDLVVANGRVEEMVTGKRLWARCPVGRRDLRVFRVLPYARSSSGASFANAVALRLAALGREGEAVSTGLELDGDWRAAVVALDARLDPDPRPACLNGEQAARALGVPYAEIAEMVRLGRLCVDARTGGIPEEAVNTLKAVDSGGLRAPRLSAGAR